MKIYLTIINHFRKSTNMKNFNCIQKNVTNFSYLFFFFILAIAVFSCSTPTANTNKEEVLSKASTLDVAFADAIIANNSTSGFADADKGKKDTLVMMACFMKEYKYDNVIKIGGEYVNRYGMDTDVEYLLATALFQQSEYAKAAGHYNTLLKQPDFTNFRMAKYYLALCYLRFDSESSKQDALTLLKQLKADPGVEFKASELQEFIDLAS